MVMADHDIHSDQLALQPNGFLFVLDHRVTMILKTAIKLRTVPIFSNTRDSLVDHCSSLFHSAVRSLVSGKILNNSKIISARTRSIGACKYSPFY